MKLQISRQAWWNTSWNISDQLEYWTVQRNTNPTQTPTILESGTVKNNILVSLSYWMEHKRVRLLTTAQETQGGGGKKDREAKRKKRPLKLYMEILFELLNQFNYLISVVGTGRTPAVTPLSPVVAVNAWCTDTLPSICSLPSSRET